MTQISPHFTLEELTYSATAVDFGLANQPDAAQYEQLCALANITLEGIRKLCGDHPMEISSGFRDEQVNALVGGAPDSAHKYGCAADFTIPQFGDVTAVCKAIEPYMLELGIDQLIHENDSWVHVGRAIPGSEPRGECLTYSGGVYTSGIVV